MSRRPPTRKGLTDRPEEDRRARDASGLAGLLRRFKGLFRRPIAFVRRGFQLHVVIVDRRKASTPYQPPSLLQLRAELRARLLGHENEQTALVMRHLAVVHDELGRRGWAGVEALPSRVLAKALVQAQMLASEEASPSLKMLIERLRPLQVAAELREERQPRPNQGETGADAEVSEATHEDYEETKRSWFGTLAPEATPPDRDK
jgi:hypothetical protein